MASMTFRRHNWQLSAPLSPPHAECREQRATRKRKAPRHQRVDSRVRRVVCRRGFDRLARSSSLRLILACSSAMAISSSITGRREPRENELRLRREVASRLSEPRQHVPLNVIGGDLRAAAGAVSAASVVTRRQRRCPPRRLGRRLGQGVQSRTLRTSRSNDDSIHLACSHALEETVAAPAGPSSHRSRQGHRSAR
jgi:hypothetical protein